MNFMEAVAAMKEGKKVMRDCWNVFFIELKPNGYTQSIYWQDNKPFQQSLDDFEAEDWAVVKEEWTLSDKVGDAMLDKNYLHSVFKKCDVKEFIKRLKQRTERSYKIDQVLKIIDELAGEKLQ